MDEKSSYISHNAHKGLKFERIDLYLDPGSSFFLQLPEREYLRGVLGFERMVEWGVLGVKILI